MIPQGRYKGEQFRRLFSLLPASRDRSDPKHRQKASKQERLCFGLNNGSAIHGSVVLRQVRHATWRTCENLVLPRLRCCDAHTQGHLCAARRAHQRGKLYTLPKRFRFRRKPSNEQSMDLAQQLANPVPQRLALNTIVHLN
jgi:hypothetical protein